MRPALSILAIAAALLLAACGEKSEPEVVAPSGGGNATTPAGGGGGGGQGGGGGGERPSPEEDVEETAVAVVGGGEPASVCGDLVTERYVRNAYGDARGCRAAVADQPRFDVDVRGIEIEGPAAGFDQVAAATAFPAGGPNKNERLEVRLVHDAGAWRVDYLRSNAPAGP